MVLSARGFGAVRNLGVGSARGCVTDQISAYSADRERANRVAKLCERPGTFTFVGDDTNVISGTTPSGIVGIPDISYSAIYQGVASVTVTGPAGVLTSEIGRAHV